MMQDRHTYLWLDSFGIFPQFYIFVLHLGAGIDSWVPRDGKLLCIIDIHGIGKRALNLGELLWINNHYYFLPYF